MTGRDLALRGKNDLARRSGELAKRGVDLARETEVVEHLLTDDEIQLFKARLGIFQNGIGKIPDAFLDGRTANPHDIDAFDVNKLVGVFNLLSIRPGYILDYVYAYDKWGGEPLLYAREQSAESIATPDEYYRKFVITPSEILLGNDPSPADSFPYLGYISFEPSWLGFVQFALFCVVCRRFYLFWHSAYGERRYIFTKDDLRLCLREKVGRISSDEVAFLQKVEPYPLVRLTGGTAEVGFLMYEPGWAYAYQYVRFRRPNLLESIFTEELVRSHEPEMLY